MGVFVVGPRKTTVLLAGCSCGVGYLVPAVYGIGASGDECSLDPKFFDSGTSAVIHKLICGSQVYALKEHKPAATGAASGAADPNGTPTRTAENLRDEYIAETEFPPAVIDCPNVQTPIMAFPSPDLQPAWYQYGISWFGQYLKGTKIGEFIDDGFAEMEFIHYERRLHAKFGQGSAAKDLSAGISQLLTSMLQYHPEKRPTAAQALGHVRKLITELIEKENASKPARPQQVASSAANAFREGALKVARGVFGRDKSQVHAHCQEQNVPDEVLAAATDGTVTAPTSGDNSAARKKKTNMGKKKSAQMGSHSWPRNHIQQAPKKKNQKYTQ